MIGEQPAGIIGELGVSPGETVRIFTGAPIPAGADAVIMQEDTTRVGDEIVLNVDVVPGEFMLAARLRLSGRPENSRIR